MKKIGSSVYYAGVLNPNMRVFDVIMRTEYGTSYNSYVVKGSEKTAIIEAAHKTFFKSYIADLEELLAGKDPDYLVLNHTEPDHSGAVADVLARWPNITVVMTKAASIYIKAITNRDDFTQHIISDGEEISLGDKTLKFISAPFLHWPDSMFTWLPEEKILFTCDFLGAHFCEPLVFDSAVTYRNNYKDAAKFYYDCIFGPFPAYVRAGLEKIAGLDIEYACTSHGPVLSKGVFLEEIIKAYGEWSAPVTHAHKRIPIFYCTAYGNTARLAEAIKAGVKKAIPDAEVETYNIIEHDLGKLGGLLNDSDAFLVGTITLNRDAVPPVLQLLTTTDSVNIAKRPAAVFGTYGWSGEGFGRVAERLASIKCNVFEKQFKINFVPSEDDLKAAEAFGAEFAGTL